MLQEAITSFYLSISLLTPANDIGDRTGRAAEDITKKAMSGVESHR